MRASLPSVGNLFIHQAVASQSGSATAMATPRDTQHTKQPQFGVIRPFNEGMIALGGDLNRWVSYQMERGLTWLLPATTQTTPIFTLNLKETLPFGMGLAYLLWVTGQQQAKGAAAGDHGAGNSGGHEAGTGTASSPWQLAREALLSHEILATTRYVYPALGGVAIAYQAGKAPNVKEKLHTTLRIIASMVAFATASLIGTGYNLAQTRADVAKLAPQLVPEKMAEWRNTVQELVSLESPVDLNSEGKRAFRQAQRNVRKQWETFEKLVLTHTPLKNNISILSGPSWARVMPGLERLLSFENSLKDTTSIAAKYQARGAITNTMNQMYQPLKPLRELLRFWPEHAPVPKGLATVVEHLHLINQPYVRLSRFLTPVAFGLLANMLLANPLYNLLSKGFGWLMPQGLQNLKGYLPDQPGWWTSTTGAAMGHGGGHGGGHLVQPTPNGSSSPAWLPFMNDGLALSPNDPLLGGLSTPGAPNPAAVDALKAP